jgi:MoxR-like ATPase
MAAVAMTTDANPFVGLKPGTSLRLSATERFAAAGHLWSQSEIDALILAWAARRPLLVRGEAGSGKSQIARAAAEVLDAGPPLVEVIHPRFEALDLLYKVDVVARLADAQIEGALDRTNRRYVKPGRLWEAIRALGEDGVTPVLLIDEIDKADADVPNALLDVLGNRSFAVPPLGDEVVRAEGERLPLIVLTTNEERELPAAFVRRCVVLNLNPPDDEGNFIDWLIDRGRVHSHLAVTEDAHDEAARQVYADRVAAKKAGYPSVGLAEYIDLLTALHALTRDVPEARRANEQITWLRRIGVYALVKNANQPQDRKAVEPRRPSEANEAE